MGHHRTALCRSLLRPNYADHAPTRVLEEGLRVGNGLFHSSQRARVVARCRTWKRKKLSDDEFSTFLLAGLGAEYDAIVTALLTQASLPSPTNILSNLLLLESRISRMSTSVEHSVSVDNTEISPEANFTRGQNKGNGGNGKGRSSSNGSQGGKTQKNYNGSNGGQNRGNNGGIGGSGVRGPSNFSGAPDNRPTCQVCSKPGHTALRCWHRFDQSYQAPAPSSFQANNTSARWFPDTAATHHYEGTDQVALGDGSHIPIANHGFQHQGASSSGSR